MIPWTLIIVAAIIALILCIVKKFLKFALLTGIIVAILFVLVTAGVIPT